MHSSVHNLCTAIFTQEKRRSGAHSPGVPQGRSGPGRHGFFARMRAVSSVTCVYTDRRSCMSFSIFLFAYMTVVWSRLPKSWPIFGSDRLVISRHRYMAICRASAVVCERDEPCRSSTVSRK